MDREEIIAYLKSVRKIAETRSSKLTKYGVDINMNYWIIVEQIRCLLKNEKMYDDEELLQEAMSYENIKPLSFDD